MRIGSMQLVCARLHAARLRSRPVGGSSFSVKDFGQNGDTLGGTFPETKTNAPW